MISKPKKTRVLSLSIIDKAMRAINDVGEIDEQVKDNISRYNLKKVYEYYNDVVEELNYTFQERKDDFERINHLYLLRERLYRIINPTIYLNAYLEKRANDALYINANVGFIDENGKVKNVVVFMGKSEETDLKILKKKIEDDQSYIDSVKERVIDKLLTKINIEDASIKNSKAIREEKKKTDEINRRNNDVIQKSLHDILIKLEEISSKNPSLNNELMSIGQSVEIVLKNLQKE
jgi:hypothetical protein